VERIQYRDKLIFLIYLQLELIFLMSTLRKYVKNYSINVFIRGFHIKVRNPFSNLLIGYADKCIEHLKGYDGIKKIQMEKLF